eukprot:CAMPEP_0168493092 /NCGR_PEP_ID=MMETSP0228-20121227/70548_1 /TAXON_ID=133427 /ORGANISM="Protoceratium reticulatum, Strain CCCM 535 (=CCMP 1889)" /LENGTH=56 /DNA_ID=CAMNT_0008509879 /DNA_START=1 /DNA_END=168 /DNA_ORIENTATION=-
MDNMVDKLEDQWQSIMAPGLSSIPLLTIGLLGGTFLYAQDFHEGSPGDYPTYKSAL